MFVEHSDDKVAAVQFASFWELNDDRVAGSKSVMPANFFGE